ncbi:MAG: hypothetical protein ABSD28_07430 [Tepidisphaeraceae bacterium]|jgi:hypothetical protein
MRTANEKQDIGPLKHFYEHSDELLRRLRSLTGPAPIQSLAPFGAGSNRWQEFNELILSLERDLRQFYVLSDRAYQTAYCGEAQCAVADLAAIFGRRDEVLERARQSLTSRPGLFVSDLVAKIPKFANHLLIIKRHLSHATTAQESVAARSSDQLEVGIKLSQAAKLYHVSQSRLSEAVTKDLIRSKRVGRFLLLEKSSIEKWLAERRARPRRGNGETKQNSQTSLRSRTPTPMRQWKCKKCVESIFESDLVAPECPKCGGNDVMPLPTSKKRRSGRRSARRR